MAAYLAYEAPGDDEAAPGPPEPDRPAMAPWMAGMGAIPASDELRNAATPTESLAALEKLFFGNVKEMHRHAQ